MLDIDDKSEKQAYNFFLKEQFYVGSISRHLLFRKGGNYVVDFCKVNRYNKGA